MKKFKKLRRVIALSLALAVAATTNLGGLENVVKIHAGTTYYGTYKESIDGVDWEVDYEINVSGGPASYRNISTKVTNKDILANKIVEIPEKIGECPVTVISAGCFAGSDIEGIIINDNIKTIGGAAFQNCSKLKYIEYSGNNLPASGFSQCTSLEEVKLSGSGTVTLGHGAFYRTTSLKKLEIADTVSSLVVDDLAFFGDTLLSDVSELPDITLGDGSFAYCRKLKKLVFNGSVNYKDKETDYEYGTFLGAFEQSDEEKEIIFNSSADIPENCFDSCTGLNKVTINGTATLRDNAFRNCKNLNTIQFGAEEITLGSLVFSACSSLKELYFNSDVNMVQNSTLDTKYGTHRMYGGEVADASIGICSNPFVNSSIEKIRFDNGKVNIFICSDQVKEIYFNSTELYGGLSECASLDTIVFENSNQLGGIESIGYYYTKPYYTFLNKCTHKCTVVGYSSTDLEHRIVENWINELEQNVKEKITFKNIISSDSLTITYDGKIVSDNPTIEDFDKTKLKVSAGYYDFANRTYNVVDINPSTDGTDVTGYITILPKSLHNGSNMFTVSFSGWTKTPTVDVIKKAPESIKVDWKEDAIKELVSNQPISTTDVISGACITYNNGDTEIVTADKLTLNKSITVAGDNTFIATLTGTDIKAEKTFTIKENYITSIVAKYESNDTVYVGDKIDINKIKITPAYKYDNDETVNRDITDFKISDTELKKAGENQFVVSYNNLQTTMVISAAAVVPTNIYAIFDNNYTYIEGQEMDPKIIAVTIEYNNGTKKSGSDIQYAYDIEVKTVTDKNIQVLVSYQGCNTTVDIPVTPKEVTSIKANAKIASATEGTTLDKTIIDKIEITYNNGKTETLDENTINYENLTFNDYTIVANQNNTIIVNYAGKTSDITIFGVSNSITGIYAEYIGAGQTIGTELPVSDVAVHAINSNGQITDITDGILLENAIPYNVGVNTVIVHYGSFAYPITVTGLPTSSISPNTSTVPNTKAPIQTDKPTVNETPIPTQPSNTVVVTTPNNANSAPTVTNTTVTLKSSNSKIIATTTKTYKICTNKSVVITINAVSASAIKYQVVAKESKLSDTAWKDIINNKITVSKTIKPSIVYIQYTDANGVVQTIHTNGFTVDKKKATVNVKKNKIYKVGKKVIFKDASGIKSAKLNGKKIKTGTKIMKSGTYKLVVTDNAGNKKSISFKVK